MLAGWFFLFNPVPRGFFVQDPKFFISCIIWLSDLKFFISAPNKSLQNFRSKITLTNKTSDLKSDLRKPLLNYNLCISSKILSFIEVSAKQNYSQINLR